MATSGQPQQGLARTQSESVNDIFASKQIKLRELESYFECVICANIFDGTTTTKCGHRYCGHCIMRHLETRQICPSCREPLSDTDCYRDHQYDSLISTLREKSTDEISLETLAQQHESGNLVFDTRIAEMLLVLMPKKDRDLRDIVDKLIEEKDKALRNLEQRELPNKDISIRTLKEKVEEQKEALKAIPKLKEKIEKAKQTEATLNKQKQDLNSELQKLKTEKVALQTLATTQQQEKKTMHSQLQDAIRENQRLQIELDEKSTVAGKVEQMEKFIKQREIEIQQKKEEVAHFKMFKDRFEEKCNEVNFLRETINEKDYLIKELRENVSYFNNERILLQGQLQEAKSSHYSPYGPEFQQRVEEVARSYKQSYEKTLREDFSLLKQHNEELQRELFKTREEFLQKLKEHNEEALNDSTSRSEVNNLKDQLNTSTEENQRLQMGVTYYKDRVTQLEEQLTMIQNRHNSP